MASKKLSLAKALTLVLTLAGPTPGANDAARAQFFFQPFGYSYRYDVPPPPPYDDERPRFATPRAVARILARRGFELTSGLGRRGDQVVVTGVSRRDGAFRFFIDPYGGEVIHAVRLAPPAGDAPPFEGPMAGAPRELGPSAPDRPPTPRRAARAPQPVEPPANAPAGPAAPAPAPAAPARALPEAAKPPEASKPIEWAKPAEIAKPPEPPKVETPKTEAPKTEPMKAETLKTEAVKPEPPKAEASTPEAAKPDPAKPGPAKSSEATPDGAKPGGAARPGVPGRRAIVAPKAPDGAAAAHR